jgi:hypothetical protein
LTRGAKQIRPDLATLEGIDEDDFRPTCEHALKACLAKVERQLAQIVTGFG